MASSDLLDLENVPSLLLELGNFFATFLPCDLRCDFVMSAVTFTKPANVNVVVSLEPRGVGKEEAGTSSINKAPQLLPY